MNVCLWRVICKKLSSDCHMLLLFTAVGVWHEMISSWISCVNKLWRAWKSNNSWQVRAAARSLVAGPQRVTWVTAKIQTRSVEWVSECVGFNVPSTHYRSFRGRFLQARWPNQQCQSTEGKPVGRQRSGLNPKRNTPPCYNNTNLGNRLYAQHKGPNVTNPICLTCKNCSYRCAIDCEHFVTQFSTELFW